MTIFSKNFGGPWPLPGYAYGWQAYHDCGLIKFHSGS